MLVTVGWSDGKANPGIYSQIPFKAIDTWVTLLGRAGEPSTRIIWMSTTYVCGIILSGFFGGILGSASRDAFPVCLSNHVGITPWLLYSSTHHSPEGSIHPRAGRAQDAWLQWSYENWYLHLDISRWPKWITCDPQWFFFLIQLNNSIITPVLVHHPNGFPVIGGGTSVVTIDLAINTKMRQRYVSGCNPNKVSNPIICQGYKLNKLVPRLNKSTFILYCFSRVFWFQKQYCLICSTVKKSVLFNNQYC